MDTLLSPLTLDAVSAEAIKILSIRRVVLPDANLAPSIPSKIIDIRATLNSVIENAYGDPCPELLVPGLLHLAALALLWVESIEGEHYSNPDVIARLENGREE